MRRLHRLIILSGLFASANVYALDFFADALYWRASETLDWVLNDNMNVTNQQVTYQTTSFNYTPGFRVGIGYETDWDTSLSYTRFYTDTNDSASGNLVSGFLPGKLTQTTPINSVNYFFQTGTVHFVIDYNILDWNIGKKFYPMESFMLHPIVGLRGGWINQTINNTFRAANSVTENLNNDFSGVGPKVGIDTKITLLKRDDYQANLIAGFSTAYVVGHWSVSDVLQDTAPRTIVGEVGSKNMGSVVMQGMLGFNADYKNFSVNLSYEINDWFNQFQIVDDATGGHSNDLVLQGLVLGFVYNIR